MNSRWLDSNLSWATSVPIAVLALCFASLAQAEPRMYTGSLIIHAFGNDTTTGTAPPFQTGEAIGIPLTGNCNTEPYHTQENLTFPTAMGNDTVMFTIPAYGGAVKTIDTNSDTVPDLVPGCGDASIEVGSPLTGSGSPKANALFTAVVADGITTTGMASTSRVACNPGPCTNPRKFTISQSELNRVKSGASFNKYGVYYWEVHVADLHNDQGAFSKGGGDGNFAVNHNAPVGQKRSAVQTAGANQFGGVMSLLGSYGDAEGYFNTKNGITSAFYYNWLFNYLGAGGQSTNAGVVTQGYITTTKEYGYTRVAGAMTTSAAEVEAFKWTTGTVAVTAVGGTFPTVLERKGYDNRTAMGSGIVQLVSPMLSKWTGGAAAGTSSSTGAVGILKLNFAPEPSEWMMLAGGVSMLGLLLLHRRGGRRSS